MFPWQGVYEEMKMRRRLFVFFVISTVFMVMGGTAVLAAAGDLLKTVFEPVTSPSGIAIGVDFDGTDILYSHYGTQKVFKTYLDGNDNGSVDLINPDGTPFTGDAPNALAYNFDNGMLYAGGWSSTNLYMIDMSTGNTTLVKANALAGFNNFNFVDGLAWDPTDDTFWMSDDVNTNVRHLDLSGNDIGGFAGNALQLPNGDPTSIPNNSGLAVSLDGTLWYGTNGVGDIYTIDTSTSPPTVTGTFAHPGGRDEDMVCGPLYTKADGTVVETLLSQDAYDDWFATFEVAPGQCISPGDPPPPPGGGYIPSAPSISGWGIIAAAITFITIIPLAVRRRFLVTER
jgi:hypothetical protein